MAKRATVSHKPRVLQDQTAAPAASADAGPGHNTVLTREDFIFYTGQHDELVGRVAAAKKALKSLRSAMKLKGFNLKQFDRTLEERDLNDDTTIKSLQDFKTYAMWLNLPIGSQMDFFATPKASNESAEAAAHRKSYDDGYQLGLMGKDPDWQKYDSASELGQKHLAGWNAAQDVYKAQFKDLKDLQRTQQKEASAKRAAAQKPAESEEGEGAREDAALTH